MIAASGERQQFVVPAASFGNVRNVAPQGLSAAVGRYQASRGSDSRTPLVATVSNGWSLGSRSTLNAGVLVSAPYHWPPGFQSTPAMRSALRSACASSASFAGEKLQGQQITANLSATPVERLSTSLSATLQTEGYRDLAQVVQAPRPDARILPSASQTHTAGVSWFSPTLGAFRSLYHQPPVPHRKAAQPRDAVLEPELRPHLGPACPWLAISARHAGAIGKPVFPDAELPLAAPAPAPMSASQAIAAVLKRYLPDTVSPQFSYSVSSSVARPDGAGQFVGIDRRDAALRARQPCPPTGVRKAACRRTGGAGLGGGRGWRGGVLAP